MLFLFAISALIKPNFILAFIPASFLFCFYLPGKRISMLVKTTLLLLPVLGVLVFQFLFTYYYDISGSSSIKFDFFDVWQHYAESIPVAILQAIAFPLAVSAILFWRLSKDKALIFSWILFVIGLLIFGLLSETGERKFDGNFSWTYMFCLNILFVFSTVSFLRYISDIPRKTRTVQIKNFLCNSIFLLHIFSGIYYVIYLVSGHYL